MHIFQFSFCLSFHRKGEEQRNWNPDLNGDRDVRLENQRSLRPKVENTKMPHYKHSGNSKFAAMSTF